jgi:hypothetical protein
VALRSHRGAALAGFSERRRGSKAGGAKDSDNFLSPAVPAEEVANLPLWELPSSAEAAGFLSHLWGRIVECVVAPGLRVGRGLDGAGCAKHLLPMVISPLREPRSHALSEQPKYNRTRASPTFSKL